MVHCHCSCTQELDFDNAGLNSRSLIFPEACAGFWQHENTCQCVIALCNPPFRSLHHPPYTAHIWDTAIHQILELECLIFCFVFWVFFFFMVAWEGNQTTRSYNTVVRSNDWSIFVSFHGHCLSRSGIKTLIFIQTYPQTCIFCAQITFWEAARWLTQVGKVKQVDFKLKYQLHRMKFNKYI